MDFTGKTAVVTGGAGGIGKAVSEGIIKGGGTAIIVDINEQTAREAQRELGDKARFYLADVGDPASIREVFSRIIKDFALIDILVCSAGILSIKAFEDISDAEWERVVRINLTGTFTACSAMFDHMKSNGRGSIVTLSSVAAKLGGGTFGTAAYASSKAGVIGLSKAIAREGAAFGIRCNAVCPAYTKTAMTASLAENPVYAKRVQETIPLRRGADPSEVANMVLFLASDLASFITGEISDVDGGLTRDG